MGKIRIDGITYDSDLEVQYAQHLKSNNIEFIYHPKTPIKVTSNNYYTPDFITFYDDRIEIIETKGYNPYSKLKDDMIHNVMLSKTENELKAWLLENDIEDNGCPVYYKKIKFLKTYGFVDWTFKNPNTAINKSRSKVKMLEQENKALKQTVKDYDRYMTYLFSEKKLTKSQLAWKNEFEQNKLSSLVKKDN